MLIGIAGAAGVGKNTLAELIIGHDNGYAQEALATPIKEMLNVLLGVDMEQWNNREWKEAKNNLLGVSPRVAAQTLGTQWRDLIDPTGMLWCNLFGIDHGDHMDKMIVTDIRFGHEQEWIRDHGGIIIYLTREGVTPVAEHISENSLNMQMIDIHIANDGTPEEMLAQFTQFYGDKL